MTRSWIVLFLALWMFPSPAMAWKIAEVQRNCRYVLPPLPTVVQTTLEFLQILTLEQREDLSHQAVSHGFQALRCQDIAGAMGRFAQGLIIDHRNSRAYQCIAAPLYLGTTRRPAQGKFRRCCSTLTKG